jgi:N-methylhydantoinase A/oxoprolinase/acetone carboxylase beta subunit
MNADNAEHRHDNALSHSRPAGPIPFDRILTGRGVLSLGIDTGGTFTDAAILHPRDGVIASAKSPTTRHDLAIGIRGAVEAALASAGCRPGEIGLVGLSTTLATNAIVEGQGARAGLILIGFDAAQLERADLRRALGADPVSLIAGGHGVHGDEASPLDLPALDRFLDETAATVEAYAVAGLFSVRNPVHELQALQRIAERTGKPATASHSLASALDGPRRALTALLNARLVPIVSDLIRSMQGFLAEIGIAAPLMVVRGNGALMSAREAIARPVETILSGPAASAVGAAWLTGLKDAVISDIGGTTTDVGILEGGLPLVDPLGARVGGYRTMIEAIRMRTTGLGGDSEIRIDDDRAIEESLVLGPRRLVPLAVIGRDWPEIVHGVLDRQLLRALPGPWDGRFALLYRHPETGLSSAEADLLESLADGPKALDGLVKTQIQHGMLMRLVARGFIGIAGLTPTDAAHILGRHAPWDAEASRKGAQLFLRRRNRLGQMHAPSISVLAEQVLARLVETSVDFILETAAEADGLPSDDLAAHPLVRRALQRTGKLVRARLSLGSPVIGLGAAASLHYPAIAERLGAQCEIPALAGVANAVGAVVGLVRREVILRVTEPERGRFRLHAGAASIDHPDYDLVVKQGKAMAEAEARAQLTRDGAEGGEITLRLNEKIVEMGGEHVLVETEIIASGTGRPASAKAFS